MGYAWRCLWGKLAIALTDSPKPCTFNAERVDSNLISMGMSHISLRVSLCELWLLGEAVDPYLLRRAIVQLTSETYTKHIYLPLTNGVLGV